MTAADDRRERTRARLQAAALELFEQHGYDSTTVAEVAKAAGVTEMTFYRHFGSKEQVVLDDPYDPLIVAAVAEQPPDLPPLVRAARGVRLAWRRLPITDEAPVRARIALVARTPSLLPVMRASTAASEEGVAARLVADGAVPHDAAVAAAAVMAALMTGLLRWAGDDDASLTDVVERTLDVVEALS